MAPYGRDHEFGNIEKCLAAGYEQLVFISSDARHLAAMAKLAAGHFEQEDQVKMHFVSPEDAIGLLGGWCSDVQVKTMRGYKVRTVVEAANPIEEKQRRAAVASVLASSMRKKLSES